jgi:hypothetical protein
MSADELASLALLRRLEDVLGPAEATTLMARLPSSHGDLTTTADLDALGTDLRAEMAALRTDLRAEMAALGTDLRAEMAALRTDLRAEISRLERRMDGFEARLDAVHDSIIATVRGEMIGAIHTQTRTLFFGFTGMAAAVIGSAFALSSLT